MPKYADKINLDLRVQAALVIRGLSIRGFAYSRIKFDTKTCYPRYFPLFLLKFRLKSLWISPKDQIQWSFVIRGFGIHG